MAAVWTEELFETDLSRISSKEFSSLTYSQFPEPSDPFLLYRYQFIQLLDHFERNDFSHSKELSSKSIPEVLKYLESFEVSCLLERRPAPPFDHILLVFLVAVRNQSNYAFLVKLFRHYQRIERVLLDMQGRVFLNDRCRSGEILVEAREAVRIIQGRINYVSELIASLLYSDGQYQLLSAFLNDFASPTQTENEETLSQLGRIALAAGDGQLAAGYFKRVKVNQDLVVANQGYVSYFSSDFATARTEFLEAKGSGPANCEVCLKYSGQLVSDPSDSLNVAKRQMQEDKWQWPLRPRQ
jgi:hypothetical protein